MAAAIRIAAAMQGSQATRLVSFDSTADASGRKFTWTISRLICRDACGRDPRNPTALSRLHQYLDKAEIKFFVPAGGCTLPLRISPAVTGLP